MGMICSGQQLHLKFNYKNTAETKIIDSILHKKKYTNIKLLSEDVSLLEYKLKKIGYLNAIFSHINTTNDSTFIIDVDLKKQIKTSHINISKKTDFLTALFDNVTDTIKIIKFSETADFLQQLTNKAENLGYSQVRVDLINFEIKKETLFATLRIDCGLKRVLNDFIIVGYDKFPHGIKKNILKTYKNKIFSTVNLKKIKNDFDNLGFVFQPKYPEILFTNDTTKVYVYLQKNKSNRFDGLVGFADDKNKKLVFNGYLDLLLVNTINAGERFNLNWKSDGNKQTTFNIGLEIPYLFKTKFALKTNLNIIKQDSIFQNTRTTLDLGYLINFNTKIFVGIQNSESTSIQTNNPAIPNFATQFITNQFDYLKSADRNSPYSLLIPEKSKLNFKSGFGQRRLIAAVYTQQFISFDAQQNFNFTEKISLNLRTSNYFLNSKIYVTNELLRFGGINSVRGFNENSLQAHFLSSLLTESRYVVSPNLYVYTVLDYAYFEDETTLSKQSISGVGAGFGLLTKGGLFQFVYANGTSIGQRNKTGNSIVHLSFKVGF